MASSKNVDIINICGENNGGHCGYCGKTSDLKSSYGITCDKMKPDTYLNLMNRGWRRCGTYFYKPLNDSTCCPLYPIRCNSSEFILSKSQKKVLKHMEDYLLNGKIRKCESVNAAGDTCESSTSNKLSKISKESAKVEIVKDNKCDKSKKAKTIRYNLKIEKLKKLADLKEVTFAELFRAYNERRGKRLEKNKPRQLSEYFDYSRFKTAKHSLTMKIVKCEPPCKDFDNTMKQEHQIYEKYQCAIHHDSPDEVKLSQFKRFLVSGGLSYPNSADVVDLERCNRLPQGQYHQQYWLDDEQLIAVGVIDILPTGLSSVYLFYDPSLSFLNLGVYSALAEINLVNKLRTKCYDDDFVYYYMGFYVHNCVKMRYKAQYRPSYIACPVTFDWVPIDKCQQILDLVKYDRFANPTYKDQHSLETKTKEQIFSLMTVLIKGKSYKLSKVKTNIAPFYLIELENLAKLIGSKVLQNLCISI